MNDSIVLFRKNIQAVRHLGDIHSWLNLHASTMNIDDILRAQLTNLSSALDKFIHDVVKIGMTEIFLGKRTAQNNKIKDFKIKQSVAEDLFKQGNLGKEFIFIKLVETEHSTESFQSSKSIKDALTLLSVGDIWRKIAEYLFQKCSIIISVSDIERKLDLIYKRRNQIVHESDVEQVVTYIFKYREIKKEDVNENIDFIANVCEAIFYVIINNP